MVCAAGLLAGFACLTLPHLSCGAVLHQSASQHAPVGPFTLRELGFPYNALEGVFVSSQTMHLHHDKHHAFYVNTLNKAVAGSKEADLDIALLIQRIQKLPTNLQGAVRNHGGGHMNHALFWRWLKPGGAQAPKGELKAKIDKDFGSFEKFQTAFEAAAATRFGSGWAWLVLEPGKQSLHVCSTANQDNPVMDVDIGDCHGTPLLGLDVWEHAYYLNYFNVRPKYVKAFWKVVNWDVVEERLATATPLPMPTPAPTPTPALAKDDHSAARMAHLCQVVIIFTAVLFLL